MAVANDLIEVQGGTAQGGGNDEREGVLSLLQQAARTIDDMWRTAQVEGQNPTAVALGEASYGVHRALIALQADGGLEAGIFTS
jgi:hypothetical protein